MSGRIDNPFAVGREISTARPAFSGTDDLRIWTIAVHGENLIALDLVARGLKDDLLPVQRPVSLGVVASEGELADVAQMDFFWMGPQALRLRDVYAASNTGRDNCDGNNAHELHFDYLLASNVTSTFTFSLLRLTTTDTTSPGFFDRRAYVKSYRFSIGLPSNPTNRSPCFRPAFAAGLLFWTSAKRTPFKSSRKSGTEPK